ncbi:hypothetical protein O181_029875 [Austropuccinia psidii MF-1]|uniref:Uncharacterized protein n=1 Tax=Austropuccinia psidii MF-1 TaxID=1389203 RepID=A0A9Q3CW26_9BASI|nr:hypothetical protein [Austropuccinia psidii MF-1]
MNPKIPLTAPIAFSMNVLGLNLDAGNVTSQNSSTWSIPNISITPILPNTQMHVSEVPGSTPEISSKANTQSKFLCDFLLNPGWNPVASQEPFGQSKQPNLNIPSGSQIHVGHESHVDGGKQKRQLKNVTQSGLLEGKPGLTLHQTHASSSRKEIMDDEDENMSLNHSETNDEPRRDDFMRNGDGTQSNSEFTHPQMPLAQSMLEKSKIRMQRNQACKAQNLEKHANQKEQQ